MGALLVKQKDGKYARYSTIVEDFTDWDLTEDDYIHLCLDRRKGEPIEQIIEDAKWVLKYNTYPFEGLMVFRKGLFHYSENVMDLANRGYFDIPKGKPRFPLEIFYMKPEEREKIGPFV